MRPFDFQLKRALAALLKWLPLCACVLCQSRHGLLLALVRRDELYSARRFNVGLLLHQRLHLLGDPRSRFLLEKLQVALQVLKVGVLFLDRILAVERVQLALLGRLQHLLDFTLKLRFDRQLLSSPFLLTLVVPMLEGCCEVFTG